MLYCLVSSYCPETNPPIVVSACVVSCQLITSIVRLGGINGQAVLRLIAELSIAALMNTATVLAISTITIFTT